MNSTVQHAIEVDIVNAYGATHIHFIDRDVMLCGGRDEARHYVEAPGGVIYAHGMRKLLVKIAKLYGITGTALVTDEEHGDRTKIISLSA